MSNARASVALMALVLLGARCSGNTKALTEQALKPIEVQRTFRITDVNMCSPEAFIMLVRRDRDVAAIKFYEPRRGDQENTGLARYTSYVPAAGSNDFRANVQRHDGTVSVEGWSGFHPFAFQRGEYRIKVGSFRLTYDFPTCLWFQDTPYEYAPTPWKDIENVDATAPHLRWFRYNATGDLSLEVAPEELLAPPRVGQ